MNFLLEIVFTADRSQGSKDCTILADISK